MKKITLSILTTMLLVGCNEPDIIYVGERTGVIVKEEYHAERVHSYNLVDSRGNSNIS